MTEGKRREGGTGILANKEATFFMEYEHTFCTNASEGVPIEYFLDITVPEKRKVKQEAQGQVRGVTHRVPCRREETGKLEQGKDSVE